MAVKSKGTTLEYGNAGDGTSTTWTPVGRLKSLKPGMRKIPAVDTTVLASNHKEQVPGLPESDDMEGVLEYSGAAVATLEGFSENATVKDWRVKYPDGGGRKQSGWISEIGEDSIENGGIITSSLKITPTGPSVFDDTI